MIVKLSFRRQLWVCSLCGVKSDNPRVLCFPVEVKP
jgi:hypothetical protein